jgi:hypothetical protein
MAEWTRRRPVLVWGFAGFWVILLLGVVLLAVHDLAGRVGLALVGASLLLDGALFVTDHRSCVTEFAGWLRARDSPLGQVAPGVWRLNGVIIVCAGAILLWASAR